MATAVDNTASEHPDGEITTERNDHLWLMGINRPQKYNGLTPKMFDELAAAYQELEENPDIRVGILFAHGDHFTAGLDLPKFADRFGTGEDFAAADDTRVDPFNRWGRRRSKPLITAVKGITFTAGIELMLAGDIVIAADNCRLSQLEPKRGIMASGGATVRFIERGGWGNGIRLLLTGEEFDAAEAYRIGLVQEVVPLGQELERAIQLAQTIAKNAPLAVQATLQNAQRYAAQGEAAAAAEFNEMNQRLAETEDFQEGVASFVERRAADFKGR